MIESRMTGEGFEVNRWLVNFEKLDMVEKESLMLLKMNEVKYGRT